MLQLHTYKNKTLLLLMASAFLLSSCSDDPASVDTEGPGEVELITQISVELDELDAQGNPTGRTVIAQWTDGDGPGGDAPTIGTIALEAGNSYSGSIDLLNTTEDPPESITEEVTEEAEDHQFFYSFGGSGITIERTDTDSNGFLLGLSFDVTVSADASDGSLRIQLLHFEDAEKTSNDFPSNQTGIDTDVDINIPIEIN